jgi:hypothetical protein
LPPHHLKEKSPATNIGRLEAFAKGEWDANRQLMPDPPEFDSRGLNEAVIM